jgi:hypothetical protein
LGRRSALQASRDRLHKFVRLNHRQAAHKLDRSQAWRFDHREEAMFAYAVATACDHNPRCVGGCILEWRRAFLQDHREGQIAGIGVRDDNVGALRDRRAKEFPGEGNFIIVIQEVIATSGSDNLAIRV